MGRTLPPSVLLPSAEAALPLLYMDANKSFRLMDLPKEIRLMVYEELRPVTRRQTVPLQEGQDHMTLVCTTIPGISILAISSQTKSEALYNLGPHLKKILATPPTIAINANHILGLTDLRNALGLPHTFWDWFLQHLNGKRSATYMKNIRRYRDGTLSEEKLRIKLETIAFTTSVNTEILQALTAFILRTIEYLGTEPSTMYKHPPLTIVVETPVSFTGLPVTTTTTKAMRWAWKFFFPMTVPPPLINSGRGDIPWLLHWFVYHACRASDSQGVISFSVKFRFLDAAGDQIGCPAVFHLPESAFHAALIEGVRDARQMGKGLLYYGGLVQERREDEI